jgi:hypothetical protein
VQDRLAVSFRKACKTGFSETGNRGVKPVSESRAGNWQVNSGLGYICGGGFMDLLTAIKREERKIEKQLGKLQHDLNRVRAAAKALGNSTSREATRVKRRVLSESEDQQSH